MRNQHLQFQLAGALLLISLPLLMAPSCSSPQVTPKPSSGVESETFTRNLQLWKTKNIANYRYTLEERCYCPLQYLGPNRIEVRDHKTVSINYVGDSRNLDMKNVQLPDTIEKVFELARSTDDKGVVYDATYGFPMSISKYGPKGTHDTSIFYSVRAFEIVK
ncbi:MAG: DUF6174 domain-containing protein [Pyrinomonadaceae bacterium]